jgi:glycosyltransferase involved in cell wall biosynthesis
VARRVLLLGAGPLPAAGTRSAPGVANRLWHFAQPLIAAGHDCLLVTLESGGMAAGELRLENAPARETQGRPWRTLAMEVAGEATPEGLLALARAFAPQRVIGAGTLLAGAHAVACGAAAGAPAWVDLFGDPLAEIQAKAEVQGAAFNADELVIVWRLVLRVLGGGAAFSSVSRRQADALLGQLALVGRLGEIDFAQSVRRYEAACPVIHTLPCCVERLEPPTALERDGWLARQGVPAAARIALWSGGFNAWADPATLVAGCELAMDRDPELWLVATGGGLGDYLEQVFDTFTALVRRSRHAARMRALGWLPLDEAQQWLAAAQVGVIVDRPCGETRLGARNRLLVHAAAAQPIVATRGCEAVGDMAADGALLAVEPGNAAALAEAIGAVLNDPTHAQTLGMAGQRFCADHYTFAATADPVLAWVAGEADARANNNATGATRAAMYIRQAMDPQQREADLRTLARLRANPLRRLIASLRRR